MAEDFDFTGGAIFRILRRIVAQPTVLLKRIGALITSRSQKRFQDQAFDGEEWPERMTPNIPGILSDLDRGASIKDRRFQSRPAVMDTGRLRASINWQVVSSDTVKIGTNLDYASVHQFGLESVMRITQNMRNGLEQLLKTFKKAEKRREWVRDNPYKKARAGKGFAESVKGLARRVIGEKYKVVNMKTGETGPIHKTRKEANKERKAKSNQKDWKVMKSHEGIEARSTPKPNFFGWDPRTLGWIFSVDEFDVQVQERPFVGVDAQDHADIQHMVRDFFHDKRAWLEASE